jgi:hypothetical protein
VTSDSNSDPKPPSEPWKDRPLTAQELADLKVQLSKMLQRDLVKFYEAGLHMCQLAQGQPPRAGFIQQLVAAWKELQRRKKGKT